MEPSPLTVQQKFELVRSVGEECITEPELLNLLTNKPKFILYDGFEPSGRMHIAQGVFKAMNVNKCTKAGGTFIFWVADWFALMNDKMGGDLEKIKTVGKYLIEVWKAAGMDMANVQFLWSSDEITKNAQSYWTTALDITRHFTIARIMKCCTIMGRAEGNLTSAQILYPIMQCTDVFFLKADICQLGVDQRKVNMLARDYCDVSKRKLKPIILSHHMLYGLKQGQAKMSKSDSASAIFMEDSAEDVRTKILAAYCPASSESTEKKEITEDSMQLVVDDLMNPCLDYIRNIVFAAPGSTFVVGERKFTNFEQVKAEFTGGKISETDLKEALILALDKLLEPVRKHFTEDEEAKNLLALIKSYNKDFVTPPLKRANASDLAEPVVIFSPLASPNWKFETLLSIRRQFAKVPKDSQIIFWIRDWSSFVQNQCGGDQKVIDASFTVLVEAIKATVPTENVHFIKQSDAILKDPSNYWISVINVGRKVPLNKVTCLDPSNQYVGFIIAALMHVGDVLATRPTVIFTSHDMITLHSLALDYYNTAQITTLPVPELVSVPPVDAKLKVPTPGFDDPDLELLLLDLTPDVARKMKKSFCEPQNVKFNPPLVLARELLQPGKAFVIPRKPENGGDQTFTSFVDISAAFEAAQIHPGDLKPVLTKVVEEFFVLIRARFAAPAPKKAVADLKNYIKKTSVKK